MSKHNLIALAVAAALAAPAAFAATVVPADEDQLVASNLFVDADAEVTVQNFNIVADAGDNYLGRTVGYNVRVRLSQGELADGDITITAINAEGQTGTTATLVSGTATEGATSFVVNVIPGTGGTQVGEGFTVSGLTITDAAALGNGGTVTVSGEVYDPTTAIALPGSEFSEVVLRADQGLDVAADSNVSTIDVMGDIRKRAFVGGDYTTEIGSVSIGEDADVAAWIGEAAVTADITVTGGNLAAFVESDEDGAIDDAGIYLVDGAETCAAGTAIVGEMTGNTVVFDDVAASADSTFNVCATANGIDPIAAQSFTVQADVAVDGLLGYSSSAQALGSFVYNGPVVEVDHFNPASNPQQQSYLRVINDSATAGRVTIEGFCQDGTRSDGVATFDLAAGASRQVNSQDLENGTNGIAGGLGSCGGGKWRLMVTGEFGSMKVQNFLRNSTSAGIINTNINNDDVINGANFPPVVD